MRQVNFCLSLEYFFFLFFGGGGIGSFRGGFIFRSFCRRTCDIMTGPFHSSGTTPCVFIHQFPTFHFFVCKRSFVLFIHGRTTQCHDERATQATHCTERNPHWECPLGVNAACELTFQSQMSSCTCAFCGHRQCSVPHSTET